MKFHNNNIVIFDFFLIQSDGVDYTGGSYTVTFGQEANDVACANIDIVVDNIFEDIEDFNTNLLPGATGDVEVGPQDNTVVFIDDLGKMTYFITFNKSFENNLVFL